jgi:SM-20-related protein
MAGHVPSLWVAQKGTIVAAGHEAPQIASAVEKLGVDGYSVSTGLLPLDLVASLAAEQRRRERAGELGGAGTGRGAGQAIGAAHRQAQSSWFNDGTAAERDYLAFADRLRLAINRRLFLGLFEFEAQFLHYPPGGFYKRHLDALHGERNRIVSMIAYLNEDWTQEDGGALSVWAAGGAGEPVEDVLPLAGTIVLMLSEEIPHEARVARRERRAIAGWFRINASSAERIDPVR